MWDLDCVRKERDEIKAERDQWKDRCEKAEAYITVLTERLLFYHGELDLLGNDKFKVPYGQWQAAKKAMEA